MKKICGLKFPIFGVSVHVLYLFSVFHIYFKSPILQGLTSVSMKYSAPAKRLVVISADGLQAEKAFHHKYASRTSFLRSIVKRNGSWGVSHTRVPTETRVGHVSILAGTYEDVSAITNGWKNNPVDFDSVINRSSTTWYWGDKGVISIFDHHAENIKSHAYGADELDFDFADKDTTKFDKWVFDNIETFLIKAKSSPTLSKQLHESKLLFFLHLNGIDTIGHAMKPDSKESLDNVAFVDKGIQNITKIFESFYQNDGLTTYIVTSDHGMTPWGSHGAGEPLETETPFVAWGAGIKRANKERHINKDTQSAIWWLEDYERHDMEQVDLAPLMAFLLGCDIPVNSVGRLPYQVLDVSDYLKAVGMLLNMRQIHEQYIAHERKVMDSAFIFQGYTDIENFHGEEMIARIDDLISNKNYIDAIKYCHRSISSALKGIQYYQHYDKSYLCLVVNISFISWMFVALLKLLKHHTQILTSYPSARGYFSFCRSKLFSVIFYCIFMTISLLLWWRSKSLIFIIFSLFPMFMLRFLLEELSDLNFRRSVENTDKLNFGVTIVLIVIGIEMLVYSFTKRGALFLLGLFLSVLPWIKTLTKTNSNITVNQVLPCIPWSVCMLLTSTYPLFPVVTREENYFLVVLAGFVGTTIGLIYSFLNKSSNVIAGLTGSMFLTVVVKMHTVVEINHGSGLPIANQIFSWSSLILLPTLAFLIKDSSIERLMSMSMSLFSIYLLMSISYEPLFLLSLIFVLVSWIFLETSLTSNESRNNSSETTGQYLSNDHVRISFIFLYFIFLSFFGTGNVASVNSFDVTSTYCFQTVYNKMVQGLIIVMKTLIPFVIVTIHFRSLHSMLNIPTRALFLIVLLMTDLMAVNFFFLIKDEGSWLDIGQSVCQFAITLMFIVVLVPIFELSNFITGNVALEVMKPHSS